MIDLKALEDTLRAIVRDELARAKPANDAPALVTVAEYARARSISQTTVRAAIRDGRLKAHRIGRAVRVAANAEIGQPVKPAGESHTANVLRAFRAVR